MAKINEGYIALDNFLSEVSKDGKKAVAEVVDNVLSTGETAYQLCNKQHMLEEKCILTKYGARYEDTLAHEILTARKPDMLAALGDALKSLVRQKDWEGRTPLEVSLSMSQYPQISRLLASGEEKNEEGGKQKAYQKSSVKVEEAEREAEERNEVTEFLTAVSYILKAGGLLGTRDEDMNQEGDMGISHWLEADLGLCLALKVWDIAHGDQRDQAEKIVETLARQGNFFALF